MYHGARCKILLPKINIVCVGLFRAFRLQIFLRLATIYVRVMARAKFRERAIQFLAGGKRAPDLKIDWLH